MKKGTRNQSFNPYFLDNRLLIQFIVSEFLTVYSRLNILDNNQISLFPHPPKLISFYHR